MGSAANEKLLENSKLPSRQSMKDLDKEAKATTRNAPKKKTKNCWQRFMENRRKNKAKKKQKRNFNLQEMRNMD